MPVNRDALLNEVRNAMVRYSHGQAPNTRVTMGLLGVTSLVKDDWPREDIIDLIAAMLWSAERADGEVEAVSVPAD